MLSNLDYELNAKRLIFTKHLLNHLDDLPQLEKRPEMHSNNHETKKKLDQILGKLYQLESEPIFEDSGNFALLRNRAPYQKLKDALSKKGLLPNKNRTYGTGDSKSFVEIENLEGIENTSINLLVRYKSRYNNFGLFEGYTPTDSLVEIIVFD
ncbi:MAG: hypothetical protein GTN36_06070 [Candidatus Aenigmarchaeota archaeon]|nr:hypothetical protein [Candidatus Aenigmarchaeota archaeon]